MATSAMSRIGPLFIKKKVQRGFGCRAGNQYSHLYYNPQYGTGIGSVFSALGRILLPIVKQGASVLKTHGIKTLHQLQQDPVKQFIANRTGQLIDNLSQKAINRLENMKGYGKKRKTKGKLKSTKGKSINGAVLKKRLQFVGRVAKRTVVGKIKKRKKNTHSRKRKAKDIFD